jgi:hypothetical protein
MPEPTTNTTKPIRFGRLLDVVLFGLVFFGVYGATMTFAAMSR